MLPATAMAQGNPGPFGGLFGRSPDRAGLNSSTVEIRSSVGGQYENAILAAEDEAVDSSLQEGFSTGAAVGLVIDHRSERFTGHLGGAASHQEYFSTPGFGVNLFSADARMSAKVAPRLEAEASAGYIHSPYFQFFQRFGQGSNAALDDSLLPFSPYAAQMLENETVDTFAGLSSQLTKRSKLSASAHRRQTQFVRQPDGDFVIEGYRGSWILQLRRGLALHADYGREHSEQRGPEVIEFEHEVIGVGVDFNRTLSVSRRTTLGFTTSTSIIKDSRADRHFRLNGAVALSKRFRRSWHATAQASRNTEFVPLFVEPVFTDSVGVSLDGMFTRRTHWMAGASGGRAQYGFSDRSGFYTVGATSRLTIALSRHLGLYGQYVAYRYEIPNHLTTLDLRNRLTRQAVSVGLTAYIPVYTNLRAPRDSR